MKNYTESTVVAGVGILALVVIAGLVLFRPNRPLVLPSQKEHKAVTEYKTFLSPLHRALIARGLQLVSSAEDLWGLEDRELAEEALRAVRALLEGTGTREAVIAAQKRVKRPWAKQKAAVLLVACVARLAASEYPKTQAQQFERCLSLTRIK